MTDVTPATFEAEVVKSDKPVVMEFWAPWCGICHTMKPMLLSFFERHADHAKFVMVNAQDYPELANTFGIMALPTFLAFRNGVVTGQHVGALRERELAQLAGVPA